MCMCVHIPARDFLTWLPQDRLQSLVDVTYKGEEDLLRKLESAEKRLFRAEAELTEQRESFDTRLSHHMAQTQVCERV